MEKPGTERPRSRPRRVKENRLPGKRPVSAIRREFVSVLLESCMCPEWFFWFNSRCRGGGSDDRHRGGSHPPTPATPPCVRVRTRRFEVVTLTAIDQGRKSKRFEVGVGKPH